MTISPKQIDSFLSKVSPEPNSGCWLWDASTSADGYGRVMLNGRVQNAHRVSYEIHVGPVPEGLVVDHLCRNRCCVNPDHLEPVTERENFRRGYAGKHVRVPVTHCWRGHLYTEQNTYRDKKGVRSCRACRYISSEANNERDRQQRRNRGAVPSLR